MPTHGASDPAPVSPTPPDGDCESVLVYRTRDVCDRSIHNAGRAKPLTRGRVVLSDRSAVDFTNESDGLHLLPPRTIARGYRHVRAAPFRAVTDSGNAKRQ